MVCGLNLDDCCSKRHPGKPVLIAGPCVLDSEATARAAAAALRLIGEKLEVPVVFKGSYWKAIRTQHDAYHGLGLEAGLALLEMIRTEYGIPVTSDVHEVCEVEKAASVLDLIQIPALLCKHTSLLIAAADTGKPVNIKKGPSVSPEDMEHSIAKIVSRGNNQVAVTERGTSLGYADTYVDFRSIWKMRRFGYPVILDCSHSVRIMARRSSELVPDNQYFTSLLASCAGAASADGLFIEVHPEPENALCDAASSFPLASLEKLVRDYLAHWSLAREVASAGIV